MSVAAPVLDFGMRDLTLEISTALQQEYGSDRHAVLRIAEAANCNTRAAENWLYGNNAPDALHLLKLMARVPALQSAMRRIVAMEADLDPELERELSAVVTRFQRMKGQGT